MKKRVIKSKAASRVLQMMDERISYEQALKKVLDSDKRLKKENLEKKLCLYV